ncbi:nuclear pore complex protein Nup50 [Parasteatoda tepidariorum]|uniref:RanBD1 domain-containing protein n=1 Tax=Parasteatoda tepidariorum TaxID=114398 RepID=A0A2L2Y4D9_PARTP|nr:nuclear pore complex protein Nup50 [Parasteatoda tepidariorum]XP_015929766.1 nuclear pore complex protein Nup50 [Parasteatoda tepidariorum]XP_015929767.1 nuclear pore complex protein Nup50 [Parasteatoda tepidariorum]XP_015929768.1 nuclear pore complex protein Nup50 [Parasteatoda tepidariorum]XP_042908595.1 nuclear pore complex protein Nup50 [Parasteatoda tepidariorum]
MAKRTAETELNHDNWDNDENSEEAGTFKRVSDNELKKRIIRKAKRSYGGTASTSNSPFQGSSPFAAFSGFGATSTPFSFAKTDDNIFSEESRVKKFIKENITKIENGKSEIKTEGSTTETQSPDTTSTATSSNTTSSNTTTSITSKPSRSVEYYRQLQSLNESVLKWMQLHLAKNAYSDFTPVFNDYKKHMDTLNVTYPVKKNEAVVNADKGSSFFKTPSSVQKKDAVDSNGKSGLALNSAQKDETDYGANFSARTTNTSSVSFGMKLTPTATSSNTSRPASSSKEEEKAQEQKPFQFSFTAAPKTEDSSASKGFSFAASVAAAAKNSETADATEEKDYEPPKNEFVKVSEEDALYSKRCKLFFKKGEGYADKGVGTLYLKSLEGKTQLLVRADTSLGNILLNIILTASLPMSRTGKNNVLLVCIPNPPVDAKKTDSQEAIPMLIRVKTAEDADELLEALNKHKS